MGNGIKRFLSLALALVMIIGLLPVTNVIAVGAATSADGDAALISEEQEGAPDSEYVDGREVTYVWNGEELAAALLNAQYIKLNFSGDVTVDLSVGHPNHNTNQNVILDLNGNEICLIGVNGAISNYGTLVITDTADEKTGAIVF